MGQVLHGCATTTHAIRAAIQRSKASLQALSERYGVDPKTVAKWRKRTTLEDHPMGPKVPHSTVLSNEEETLIVAFRRQTLLPLDDCLYALQATIPHLTRSSHRLFQRHASSCLPTAEGDQPRRKFKAYPIGYIHVDFAEVWTKEGKLYLFVWPSTGSASSPSQSFIHARPGELRPTSFAGSSTVYRTEFTPCSPTTAFNSPPRMAAGASARSSACSPTARSFGRMRSTRPVRSTPSIIASRNLTIRGLTGKSNA